MAVANSKGLHTVELNEDYVKKLRAHRRNTRLLVILVIVLAGLSIYGIKSYFDIKEYTDYEIVSEAERPAGAVSDFMLFAGGVLRYNYDGAMYTTASGDMMWNQTYEMEDPRAAVSAQYAAVYEFQGKELYLMSTESQCMGIDTTVPIKRVSVSDSGTVAVLMEENGVSRIGLYDKAGTELAGGEIYSKNSGYPMDIAISPDGTLLAVAILNIGDAKVKTNIVFYNFGTVGRSEVDNIVASYSYDEIVVPRLYYMKGGYAVAYAQDQAIVFSGSQKPEEYAKYPITGEVKSIFYNRSYFGVSYNDRIEVYAPEEGKVFEYEDDFDDCDIQLMDNNEITAIKNDRLSIYNLRGIKRYDGDQQEGVVMVIPRAVTHYLFITADKTMEVRLK